MESLKIDDEIPPVRKSESSALDKSDGVKNQKIQNYSITIHPETDPRIEI